MGSYLLQASDGGATTLLPNNAGASLLSVHHQSGSLAPWTGFAVMCAYAAVAIAGAAYALKRRDA